MRQAIGYAIDRKAIVDYLRRGLATQAVGILPPVSWAFEPDVLNFNYDPAKARALLDEAGYRDPDGDGPEPRLRLSLKVSNVEFNRLQSAVIQQNLREVGIALDVRTYEFTLCADVVKAASRCTLQWTGGAVADRTSFGASSIRPSTAYRVQSRLLQRSAGRQTSRRRRCGDRRRDASLALRPGPEDRRGGWPYISLHKTNVAVSQRTLTGIHVLPLANFIFLKDGAHGARAQ